MSTTYDIEPATEATEHSRRGGRAARRRLHWILGASVLLAVLVLELFVLGTFGIFFPL